MSKRYAVLGLSVVLALALAVPALGGPSNPIAGASATVKATAAKALKKAKAAQKTANAASATANAALAEANNAQGDVKKAQTAANTAQATANLAKTTADSAKATADSAKAAAAAAEANANTRIKNSTQIIGELSAENNTSPKFAGVACGTGQVILGGGYAVGGEANKVTVTGEQQQLYGGGWFVSAHTIAGQAANWSIQAIAMCGTK